MKITDIRTLSLSRAHEPERQWYSATFHVPKADCSICVIETDEGLQGIAELPELHSLKLDLGGCSQISETMRRKVDSKVELFAALGAR